MKANDLLEAVGEIDEEILAMEKTKPRRAPWRYLLAAVIVLSLATTAFAVGYSLVSKPIGKVAVVTEATAFPFTADPAGNIVKDPQGAVLVNMETQYDAQVPACLEELYEIKLPEGWKATTVIQPPPEGAWVYDTVEQQWQLEGRPGWISLGQTVGRRHIAYGENCVDVLYALEVTQPITAEKARVAGLDTLKVTVPPHAATPPATVSNYCEDGQTRLYWCDGRYILCFAYPTWMEDREAEQILTTLTVRKAPWSYPETYGKIDSQRIGNVTGNFRMEGLTVPQYVYLYSDGWIWFGEYDRLMKYEVATGKLDFINLGNSGMSPRFLYDAGDYIGFYANDMQYRILKNGQGSPECIGEGYFFRFFYDMWSYDVEENTVVRTHIMTGERQVLAEGVSAIWPEEGKIRVLPTEDPEIFWVYDMECTRREAVPGNGQWLDSIWVGGVKVLSGEYGRLYLETDGQITSMGVKSSNLAVCNDRLYYQRDSGSQLDLCVYDPAQNTHETVLENVFEFALLENRYLVCTKTGEEPRTRGDVHVLLDLQTGQMTELDP